MQLNRVITLLLLVFRAGEGRRRIEKNRMFIKWNHIPQTRDTFNFSIDRPTVTGDGRVTERFARQR